MSRRKAILYLVIAAMLWSTGGILIKNINQNAFVIAGIRSGIAACVIYFYMHQKKINVRFNKTKVVGALMYMLMVVLYVIANKLTTPANAILLQFTAPIWVAILAKLFLKECIKTYDWLAIFIVLLGLSVFFMEELSFTQILGNSLAILSGVALASVLVSLKIAGNQSAVEITFLGNALTLITCLAFIIQAKLSPLDLGYLFILGVFQLGISYVIYALAVQHVTAVEAILITIIEPILNPVWVFLFSGESLSMNALIGGAIVIITVIIRGILPYFKYKKSSTNTTALS